VTIEANGGWSLNGHKVDLSEPSPNKLSRAAPSPKIIETSPAIAKAAPVVVVLDSDSEEEAARAIPAYANTQIKTQPEIIDLTGDSDDEEIPLERLRKRLRTDSWNTRGNLNGVINVAPPRESSDTLHRVTHTLPFGPPDTSRLETIASVALAEAPHYRQQVSYCTSGQTDSLTSPVYFQGDQHSYLPLRSPPYT
jgi:hypothetical protein